MKIYADTSFFVSLYLTDSHTAEAEHRVTAHPQIWLTPLHVAEWTHAIEQHVYRKFLTRAEADRLEQRFTDHRSRALWKESAVPERAFELCADLARKFAGRLGTRTLDTLHVVLAIELNASEFWSFDERQIKLARAIGLRAE